MAPQIVLITGCSSGIGLATAVLLAKTEHEFKVYATMRNLGSKGDLEKAAGDTLNKTLFIRELDVTKDDTIKTVIDEILQENGRIDVLVNNAGVAEPDVVGQKPLEWCQAMMDTNYWGIVRCIRAVLPAMKEQKSGRILNVSSMGGAIGSPFCDTYSSSKFAVEGFSESIAPVLRDAYNIRVSIIQPGPVQTRMFPEFTSSFAKMASDLDDVMKSLHNSEEVSQRRARQNTQQSPEEIAQLHLEVILSENPHLRYPTSEAMKRFSATKLVDPTTDALLDGLKH